MKRDWEVIRKILLELQDMSRAEISDLQYRLDNYDEDRETLHVFMLYDAGFLQGIDTGGLAGRGLMSPTLTWEGHELLAKMESKPVWDHVKAKAAEQGVVMSFDVVMLLAKQAINQIFS
jgi:hypothetical protein